MHYGLEMTPAHNTTVLRATTKLFSQSALTLAGLFLLSDAASAGKILDFIRDYDLNDYAFGVSFGTGKNPYIGGENYTILYPYLTSFQDSAFTEDWFLIRDGAIGARWVSDNGWELGAVGRIETLGLGASEAEELIGVEDRKWTIEMGPTIGWRRWPVQFHLTTYREITGRHDGLISEFSMSLPFKWSRGYVVPSVELIYQDSDYVNYYYGVSSDEATSIRPAYSPSDAYNTAIQARWGYALSEKFLLSGSFSVEYLDSVITNSPIVGRDTLWSAHVGLAYNANIFQSRVYEGSNRNDPRFNFRVGAFYDNIDSKVTRDTADGVPGFEVDVEDFLGAADEDLIPQLDATYRIGQYHSLEAGYFELRRKSSVVLDQDFSFGDINFPAGTQIDSRLNSTVFHMSYAYSLIRDHQKELAFMAGLHVSHFDTEITADDTGDTQRSNVGTPLPVLGVLASVAVGQKSSINAKLQFFRMDFDHYQGSLNYFTIDLKHDFSNSVSAGLGYNYYGMNLGSNESEANGYLKLRHRGPVVFMTVRL